MRPACLSPLVGVVLLLAACAVELPPLNFSWDLSGSSEDLGGAAPDLAEPMAGPWRDPYPPLPAANGWPAGTSMQRTAGGTVLQVDLPAGDTAGAALVLGGWSVKHASPAAGFITLALQGDGALGPRACGGAGMSGVPHLLSAANVREVLQEAGRQLRFDHRRVFVEADGNNAGYGVEAALDGANQPYVTGVYVPWAEYNNAPCRAVTAPAGPASPRALFISAAACDDTYCPLKSCIDQVRGHGYAVDFQDPLTAATCDCRGACPGSVARPHFRGPGASAPIGPWLQRVSR